MENSVFRRIMRAKRKVTEGWEKSNNGEHHN
jgi:hypothetical protein